MQELKLTRFDLSDPSGSACACWPGRGPGWKIILAWQLFVACPCKLHLHSGFTPLGFRLILTVGWSFGFDVLEWTAQKVLMSKVQESCTGLGIRMFKRNFTEVIIRACIYIPDWSLISKLFISTEGFILSVPLGGTGEFYSMVLPVVNLNWSLQLFIVFHRFNFIFMISDSFLYPFRLWKVLV